LFLAPPSTGTGEGQSVPEEEQPMMEELNKLRKENAHFQKKVPFLNQGPYRIPYSKYQFE